MKEQRNGRGYECLVIDLNTQYDYCDPAGALPVTNLESLVPALRRVIAWAKRNYAPIVSSIESHRPFELSDSGQPICCVDGSGGQRKVGFTLFPLRATVEVDNTLAMPVDLFKHFQQIIFRKRSDDLLANPKADRLFSYIPVGEFILFGSGLENSVKALALALRARARAVTVVSDACGYWDRAAADLAVRQMAAKGADVITSDELLQRKLGGRYRRRLRWAVEITRRKPGRPGPNGHSLQEGTRPGNGTTLQPGTRGSAHDASC